MIQADKLTKKFGSFTAVDAVSFEVPKGVIAAFLGPNGAGKTTTIKMLTTLLEPTSGTFTINGFANDKVSEVRKSFGIVFQDPSLDDDLSALENLMFHASLYGVPKAEALKKVDEVLALVELGDRAEDMVKTFSGGMKRRLEIARSLVHVPAVLFLDEPTVGLDPQTRNKMWEYIVRLKEETGKTVLFTTHYMEEAEKAADIVFIIDHGKIMAQGSVDEIKKSTGTKTLEEAFLKLTGENVRPDEASQVDQLRAHARAWGGGRR